MASNEIKDLQNRVDALKRDLHKKQARVSTSNWAVLIIGLIALGLMSAYFAYGYVQFKSIADPKILVDLGKEQFDKHLVEVRQTAATEIRKSAPQWAEELSGQLVENMPSARRHLEETLTGLIDDQLANGKQRFNDEFRSTVSKNRNEIQEAIDLLAEQDDRQAFVNRIIEVIETDYQPELRGQALQVLGVVADLNVRLKKLAEGKDLNPIEQKQRHILGLARYAQLQNEAAQGSGKP